MSNLSFVEYTGNGGTSTYSVPFNYLLAAHVKAKLDGVETSDFTVTGSDLTFTSPPASDVNIRIYRETPRGSAGRLVAFSNASIIQADDLDTAQLQNLYIAEEAMEVGNSLTYSDADDAFDAQTQKISNVVDPVAEQDVTTKKYVDDNTIGLTASQWDAEAKRITNAADPTVGSDLVTKDYVDSIVTWGTAGEAQAVSLTTTSATNLYTLTGMASVSQNMLVVSLDGVHLSPGEDFTVNSLSPNSQIVLIPTPGEGQNLVVQNFGQKRFVPTAAIGDAEISVEKLAENAVTSDQLSTESVITDSLATNAITSVKIADNNVTTSKIQDSGVTSEKLSASAVTEDKIADGSIGQEKLKVSGFGTSPDPTFSQFVTLDPSTGDLNVRKLTLADNSDLAVVLTTLTVDYWAAAVGPLAMGTNGGTKYKVVNMADPTVDSDAATKFYVDQATGSQGKSGELIANIDADGTTQYLEAEDFNASHTYTRYEVVLTDVRSTAGDGVVKFQIFDDNLGWLTDYDYNNQILEWGATSVSVSGEVGASAICIYPEASGTLGMCGKTCLFAPVNAAPNDRINGTGTFRSPVTGGNTLHYVANTASNGEQVNGIRVFFDSGNVVSGANLKVYGYRE